LLERIEDESLWLGSPALADVFVRGEAFQRFEPSTIVVGVDEVGEVAFELAVTEAAMQGRPRQMRDDRLQCIETIISGSSVCFRKATMIASSSTDNTVDFASFGPVGRSTTLSRAFHLATVF
jgi:hypothetical protein